MKYFSVILAVAFFSDCMADWVSSNGQTRKENFQASNQHVEIFLPPSIDGAYRILFEIYMFKTLQEGVPGLIPPYDSYINVWKIDCDHQIHRIDQIRFMYNESPIHTLSTKNQMDPIETSTREIYKNHSICTR